MPASLAPLRMLLGALCVFFAYYLGRSLAARFAGTAPPSRVIRWGLRVAVAGFGSAWGGLDKLAMILLGLAVLSAGLGCFSGHYPRKPGDDLTRVMFPRQ
jgi:hypothetical protein